MIQRAFAALSLLAAGLVAAALAPRAAAEEPETRVTLEPGKQATWNGPIGNGANQSYDAASGEPCGDGPEVECHTVLLNVDVPRDYWDRRGGGIVVFLEDFTVPASDFDVYIYKSNADGTKRGRLVGQSAGLPGEEERAEVSSPVGNLLVQVVYYQVTASGYKGRVKFNITGRRSPNPPDVDRPRGIQDVLASDPRKGYRSHSEMHVAQSPLNPDLLVAASKFYNKDADSLREYEFKVGTYVSFNGGRSWRDLGQTRVCKPAAAPPRSWPTNSCYPRDSARKEGTGEEDGDGGTESGRVDKAEAAIAGEVGEIGEAEPVDVPDGGQTRGSDFGEEYITSDPWVAFDDEGNAYLMVLDSPPFDHGNGWGMSFHVWRTPSRKDLRDKRRKTWSRSIPINEYSGPEQADFLDDKNTFAVNNAGEDRDGEPGIIVACWGQNIVTLIKQQTVCERSTDGGRSWPDAPLPISPPDQQLVIGVSVVADSENPQRFYAIWMNYTGELINGPAEYWFSQSTDGGQSWSPASFVTGVNGIPNQFPGSEFRNLSIPIMAAGPKEGELYATYAAYRAARSPKDRDGMQADILLVRSSDGGATWSAPKRVNRDRSDADQFQPAPAVTPSGQLNIAWFDRRHDPNNFYIDTYLARSNDSGKTFQEARVSHQMWDPDQKPPVSPSGDFIGDYQGLVADDCAAIPFVNDTHLAEKRRDKGFDRGLRRSKYQEAISWRVPNKPRYGGERVRDADC